MVTYLTTVSVCNDGHPACYGSECRNQWASSIARSTLEISGFTSPRLPPRHMLLMYLCKHLETSPSED